MACAALGAPRLTGDSNAVVWCIDGDLPLNLVYISLLFPDLPPSQTCEVSIILPDFYKSDVFELLDRILGNYFKVDIIKVLNLSLKKHLVLNMQII